MCKDIRFYSTKKKQENMTIFIVKKKYHNLTINCDLKKLYVLFFCNFAQNEIMQTQ